ncbi:hypothetical protein Tco_0090092 [Tanacetum coccineum]
MNREPMRRIKYGMIVRTASVTPEGNAQENNANPKGNSGAGRGSGRGRGVGRGGKITEEQFRVMIAAKIAKALQEFNGEGDAVTTMKWVREMESVINASNYADDEKVKYVTHSFKSEALFWWDMIIDVHERRAIECLTWEEFKEAVINKFCPEGELQ